MKTQDIIFFLLLLVVLALKGKWSWHLGIAFFILSGILFFVGNLFTAQRSTWYAAAFMGVACIRQALHSLPKHN